MGVRTMQRLNESKLCDSEGDVSFPFNWGSSSPLRCALLPHYLYTLIYGKVRGFQTRSVRTILSIEAVTISAVFIKISVLEFPKLCDTSMHSPAYRVAQQSKLSARSR